MNTSIHHHIYSTYSTLQLIPAIVLMLILWFLGAIIPVLFSWKLLRTWLCFEEHSKKTLPLSFVVIAVLKIVYADGVDKRTCKNGDGKTGEVFSLYKKKINLGLVIALFAVTINILGTGGAAFFVEFLVEESSVCDIEVDCFALNKTDYTPIQQTPLMEKCTDYENDDYIIECYQFAFDYASGLSHASGVIFIASLTMKIQAALMIQAGTLKHRKVVRSLLFWVTLFICFTVFLITLSVDVIFDQIYSSTVNTLNFFIYFICFSFTITSGFVFVNFSRSLPNSSSETSVQYGSLGSTRNQDMDKDQETTRDQDFLESYV